MKKQAGRKLRGRAGESIAETLVALLISALALLMLAGAVSSATNAVLRSKSKMTAYYATDTAMITHGEGSAEGSEESEVPEMAYKTESGTVTIEQKEGSVSKAYDVTCYINEEFGTTAVTSFTLKPNED